MPRIANPLSPSARSVLLCGAGQSLQDKVARAMRAVGIAS